MSPVASKNFTWKLRLLGVTKYCFQPSHEMSVYSSPLAGVPSGSNCCQYTAEGWLGPPARSSQNGAMVPFGVEVEAELGFELLLAVPARFTKPFESTRRLAVEVP